MRCDISCLWKRYLIILVTREIYLTKKNSILNQLFLNQFIFQSVIFSPCLIALQLFKKDDMLVNYHGKVVININADQYRLQTGVLSEYALQIAGPPRRLIGASN